MPKDGSFDYDAAENMFFAAQTIQNACGTQALLSVLLNKDGEIDIGPQLREFKEFTTAFPADVSSAPALPPTPHNPNHDAALTAPRSSAAKPSPTAS